MTVHIRIASTSGHGTHRDEDGVPCHPLPRTSDDVLEEFEHAFFVRRGAFGLHEGDGLHFALEDEEPIVVQIDSLLPQEDRDLFVSGRLVVHVIPE